MLTDRARELLAELAEALDEDPRHVLEDVLRSALARHRRKQNLAENGHAAQDQTEQETVTIPAERPDLPDTFKWMRLSPITQLEDRLWLGGYADVREPEKLRELGITAIANVSDLDVIPSKEGFKCLFLDQRDQWLISDAVLDRFLRWMDETWAEGHTVAVHCHAGISRTIAFTIAWYIHRRGYHRTPDLAREWRQELDRIGAMRPVADPHKNLRLSVLRYFEQRIRTP